MPDLDGRLIVYGLWGGGTVIVYGRVLWNRRKSNLRHHDRRSRRDYLEAFGLFIVALCSALAIAGVIFGTAGTNARSAVVAMALGAFLGVGLFMMTESERE